MPIAMWLRRKQLDPEGDEVEGAQERSVRGLSTSSSERRNVLVSSVVVLIETEVNGSVTVSSAYVHSLVVDRGRRESS